MAVMLLHRVLILLLDPTLMVTVMMVLTMHSVPRVFNIHSRMRYRACYMYTRM